MAAVPVTGATLVPKPTVVIPTPMPVLKGIYMDGACWRVDVDGVKEIWVNGKGVSNGMFCGVSEIRVVVK